MFTQPCAHFFPCTHFVKSYKITTTELTKKKKQEILNWNAVFTKKNYKFMEHELNYISISKEKNEK